MLSKQQVALYKERLIRDRAELVTKLTGTRVPDFGNDVDASDEETSEAEELGNRLAVDQVTKDHVNEIDAALNKIENGTYGVCDRCGRAIEEKILAIAPESLLCEQCKRLHPNPRA